MRDVSRGTSDVDRQMEQLVRGCGSMGVDLEEEARSRFSLYIEELLQWNRRINLMSRRDTENIVSHHILDSLSILLHVEMSPGTKLIDIGSGGGFPGIPLKICRPQIDLVLVESTGKKALFLKHMVDVLRLGDAVVLRERAEDLLRESTHRDLYDMAVARAVAPLGRLAPLCLPFVRSGGLFLSMKGGSTEDEIEEAQTEIKILKGHIEQVIDLRLPLSDKKRQLVLIKKDR